MCLKRVDLNLERPRLTRSAPSQFELFRTFPIFLQLHPHKAFPDAPLSFKSYLFLETFIFFRASNWLLSYSICLGQKTIAEKDKIVR